MIRDHRPYTLFPDIAPYSTGFLNVDDTHNLYWEQSGNPDGIPILMLHGGPGAGSGAIHRRFFNPDHYRIIIFDQRGAGRSTPLGNIKDNTPAHLVGDIEKLRHHLNIEKWHLFGGSWGATLALLYATQYPQTCLSMILRGIFLCEQNEIDWFLNGAKTVFPDAWQHFTDILSPEEQNDILCAYITRLNHEDTAIREQAAITWSQYESACSSLIPTLETIITQEQKDHALAIARIEAHYFKHAVIDTNDSLLNKIDNIRHIPCTIIQGRYDMVCPIITANKLHHAWPEADYIIVPDAGHSALDPTLCSRLIEATEQAKSIL